MIKLTLWLLRYRLCAENRCYSHYTMQTVSRRKYLSVAAAPMLGLPLLGLPSVTLAQSFLETVTQRELEALKLSGDGIMLEFPRLADTGSSVPISANIEAPAGTRIVGVDVYLPENPNTRALRFRLAEPAAKFNFTTRLRLAATQNAWVVVTLTDGSRRGTSLPTIITSSACFDES